MTEIVPRAHEPNDPNHQSIPLTHALPHLIVQIRLNSIKNIGKITKSMKMIASTKVAKAQRAMEQARIYGSSSSSTFLS